MKRFTASIEDGPRCWTTSTSADSPEQAIAQLRASYPGTEIACLHEGWTHEGENLLNVLYREGEWSDSDDTFIQPTDLVAKTNALLDSIYKKED